MRRPNDLHQWEWYWLLSRVRRLALLPIIAWRQIVSSSSVCSCFAPSSRKAVSAINFSNGMVSLLTRGSVDGIFRQTGSYAVAALSIVGRSPHNHEAEFAKNEETNWFAPLWVVLVVVKGAARNACAGHSISQHFFPPGSTHRRR
jgi:hypothetical protein